MILAVWLSFLIFNFFVFLSLFGGSFLLWCVSCLLCLLFRLQAACFSVFTFSVFRPSDGRGFRGAAFVRYFILFYLLFYLCFCQAGTSSLTAF